MNRIAASTILGASTHGSNFATGSTTALRERPADDHALFTPLHYEQHYAYPLIVWLHGAGGNEHQLRKVMPLISLRNYVGVAARGTIAVQGAQISDDQSSDMYSDGFSWCQSEDQIMLASHRVMEAVDLACERFNIAPRRIFLTGIDTGGTMAMRLAMRHPQHFAGVLSLGGAFPSGLTPFSRLTDARRLPLFVACGRESQAYPAEQVCDDLRLWHSAGMSVTLRQYPCGDEVTSDMFSDMDRWVMEQIVPPQPAASEPVSRRLDSAN